MKIKKKNEYTYTNKYMFTLRTVFTYGRGSEVKETTNRFLGENYQVYYRDSHLFKERINGVYQDETFNAKLHYENVFAILLTPDKEIELLYDTSYYIVTDSGKTFEKIYQKLIVDAETP